MRKPISIFAAGAVMVAGAVPCAAQTAGPYTTSTPIPLTATDWSGTLLLPQFDPSLGVLISVQLSFSCSTATLLTVQNISNLFGPAKASAGTAFSEVQLTVQDGGSFLSAPQLDLFSNFNFSLAAGGSVNSSLLTQIGSGTSLYTQSAVLAEFTGAGNISLSASTLTQSGLTYTGGITFSSLNSVDASLTGSVLYSYTPVPEPTELALASLAGLSLIIFRRHRK